MGDLRTDTKKRPQSLPLGSTKEFDVLSKATKNDDNVSVSSAASSSNVSVYSSMSALVAETSNDDAGREPQRARGASAGTDTGYPSDGVRLRSSSQTDLEGRNGGGYGFGAEFADALTLMRAPASESGVKTASVISYTKTDAGRTVYNIEVRFGDGRGRKLIRRRYNEFYALHESLKGKHPTVAKFTFPGKVNLTSSHEATSQYRQGRFDEYLKVVLDLDEERAPEVNEWLLANEGETDDGDMDCLSLSRFATSLSSAESALHIETRQLPIPKEGEVLIQVGGGHNTFPRPFCVHQQFPFRNLNHRSWLRA